MNIEDIKTFVTRSKSILVNNAITTLNVLMIRNNWYSNPKITLLCNSLINVNLNYLKEIEKILTRMTENTNFLVTRIYTEISKVEQ